ncbi:MAG: DUF2070 family protein [Candidatus Bathyarchaeota archaeon]|nr:DUF2070 family protein [Candidatus Bathyarchaeota archaeon]
MAAEGSLNQSMNKAQRHYRSLFSLPSFNKTLVALAALCIIAGISSTIFFPSADGLSNGLLLGTALFVVNLAVDVFLTKVVLKDPIFVLRRVFAVSLFSWGFWIVLLFVGAAFGLTWWIKLCLLGFAALLTLRAVVFLAVLSTGWGKRLVAILLQPFACLVAFAVFWTKVNVDLVALLPYVVIMPIIACVSAYIFIHLIDQIGKKDYGEPSMSLFQAFMLNWVASLNAPLERYLERTGEDADVEVSLLKFDASKPKAALIVPLVHPGPFNNIGSSILPSLLKREYEKAIPCDVCVPLGILGHELDAASQAQNHKIIRHVIQEATYKAQSDKATPLVTVSENGVTTSCQVFGKTAFLNFTLAPKTTEDLPQELDRLVRAEATKLGLEALVINAHNSLTESNEIDASIETLKDAAAKCLKKAVSQHIYPFEVGSATVYPSEFTLKDGMGAGGITAIVVKVDEQKTAYVVIDGNNMITGLREEILAALASAGFEASEVFTTDTHSVSAVVIGRRGYHPVGEAMDHQTLINHIVNVASQAANNLESYKAGYQRIIVPKVRVIGGGCLEIMTGLVDKAIQKAKQTTLPIFGLEGLFLLLLLFLL